MYVNFDNFWVKLRGHIIVSKLIVSVLSIRMLTI